MVGSPQNNGGNGGEGSAGAPAQDPSFSFFVTSQAGLLALAAEMGRDPVNGFGGNLGGLEGADAICMALAQRGNPGDTKTWRAFLSSTGQMAGSGPVNAVDRIGEGPWYDFRGRLLAMNLAGLAPDDDGRPSGADDTLAELFTDENGDDARPNENIDNHDTLTGSEADGTLHNAGLDATCMDWTSDTLQASGDVPVGHSWPRTAQMGREWIMEHTINGCEPGGIITGNGAAADDDFRVGGGGGYGGFYCFALGAVAP
jgi:hypothetical protein